MTCEPFSHRSLRIEKTLAGDMMVSCVAVIGATVRRVSRLHASIRLDAGCLGSLFTQSRRSEASCSVGNPCPSARHSILTCASCSRSPSRTARCTCARSRRKRTWVCTISRTWRSISWRRSCAAPVSWVRATTCTSASSGRSRTTECKEAGLPSSLRVVNRSVLTCCCLSMPPGTATSRTHPSSSSPFCRTRRRARRSCERYEHALQAGNAIQRGGTNAGTPVLPLVLRRAAQDVRERHGEPVRRHRRAPHVSWIRQEGASPRQAADRSNMMREHGLASPPHLCHVWYISSTSQYPLRLLNQGSPLTWPSSPWRGHLSRCPWPRLRGRTPPRRRCPGRRFRAWESAGSRRRR
jgi:hypothetical protein